MDSFLRVFEAVLLASKQGSGRGVDGNELDAVTRMLQTLEINALADRELAALRGGQRQLVSIAQAMSAPQVSCYWMSPQAHWICKRWTIKVASR
jgi:ABC-type cobalamin/Fe3+-siderophores transport system ATPase subunit